MEWGETYFLKLIIVDLMMSKAFRRSFSLIVKGGAKRMISPCVGLASTPFSANLTQTSQASYFSAMTMAFKSPFPRTSFTTSVSKVLNSFLKKKKKSFLHLYKGKVTIAWEKKTCMNFCNFTFWFCLLNVLSVGWPSNKQERHKIG